MNAILPTPASFPSTDEPVPAGSGSRRWEKGAARSAEEQAAIDRIIDAFDAFHAKHGLLSDEFSTL